MLDFFRVCVKEPRGRNKAVEIYPDFTVGRSKDLMIQGGDFYAIWDEEAGLWSRDSYDVQRLVDKELVEYAEKNFTEEIPYSIKFLSSFDNGRWKQFKAFMKNVSDNSHPLDSKVTFANTEIKRNDYVSRRLPYDLVDGPIDAYDELVSTLYAPEEREKFEWAIGAIISGDAKKIQKFLVFYGGPGTGKSTIMDIIQKLFGGLVRNGGYVETFDAKALVGNNNAFATEAFKANPLVAIQHDGDLSKIEDNSKLNSIVSHEDMTINEKYKATYSSKINAFLFMGTNKPVMISDSKSGLIRRLIDVRPTRVTLEPEKYFELTSRVDFELGAIAHHCLGVYRELEKSAYSDYKPTNMMFETDVFFNYVDAHFDIFKGQQYTTLKQAWELYKEYAKDAQLSYSLPMYKFREKLKDYFEEFHDRISIDGSVSRSVYENFVARSFKKPIPGKKKPAFSLRMEETESILDEMYAGMPAQYANSNGNPLRYWDGEERLINGEMKKPKKSQIVDTVLGDLDTSRLHFVKVPEHHIVIDFDLKDDKGEKSLDKNLEAASAWPATYAEISKSGAGVHLHYTYDGDVSELASVYSEDIEIKVYTGNSSLRRRLTKCNNVSIATLSGGLPFKEKKMLPQSSLQSEQGLRNLIVKNLRKEIHPGTKPSMDFIEHVLRQAKANGVVYDVSDMLPDIMAFANNSKKNFAYCLKIAARLDLKSDDEIMETAFIDGEKEPLDDRLVFFDCEVYPNLFIVCWKYEKSDSVVRMINPSSKEVEQLFLFKLVGYNNRKYDNHILWARFLGASNEDLYRLSQRIVVEKDYNAFFGQAYGISYADVLDFSVEKKSLKKWEIDLGIPHVEMDIPWDQPVPDDKILKVADYCCNDVNALEAVFNHLHNDFVARQILADLSGLTVNDTTRNHAEKIIFGDDREPQRKFVYTDLSKEFPGYIFNPFSKTEKSTYCDEVVGEGGYVYSEPGIYENVALLDVASMHPTSIVRLNLFGPYTEKFKELMDARLAIKHGEFDKARRMFNGKLAPYLEGLRDGDALDAEKVKRVKALSNALKLVINSVYGLTMMDKGTRFRDPRNKDNIVAKRGALFMIDLKRFVQQQGYTVAHIKTDSIKIPNATREIIEAVMEFGKDYGYTFEHEETYEKMCLVNDAVYIAKVGDCGSVNGPEGNTKNFDAYWTATGAEFKHPYVFKTLFSHEPIDFKDLCETKQVSNGGAMYLRFPEGDIPYKERHKSEAPIEDNLTEIDPGYGDTHIGRSGMFVPISPRQNKIVGGTLLRIKNGKEYAISGTKGYLWLEAEMLRELLGDELDRMSFEHLDQAEPGTGSIADIIDMSYFSQLAEDAAQHIDEFGSFEEFVS